MIYTLRQEVFIMLLLIMFGLYMTLYYELINIICYKFKHKVLQIFFEILSWSLQIFISYKFIYQIKDGDIPIYFILFILCGVFIYIPFKTKVRKVIDIIFLVITIMFKILFKNITQFMFPNYLKEIIQTFKKRKKDKRNKDVEVWKG